MRIPTEQQRHGTSAKLLAQAPPLCKFHCDILWSYQGRGAHEWLPSCLVASMFASLCSDVRVLLFCHYACLCAWLPTCFCLRRTEEISFRQACSSLSCLRNFMFLLTWQEREQGQGRERFPFHSQTCKQADEPSVQTGKQAGRQGGREAGRQGSRVVG